MIDLTDKVAAYANALDSDIQAVIDEYRRDHPEEYRDDEAERLRGMMRCGFNPAAMMQLNARGKRHE